MKRFFKAIITMAISAAMAISVTCSAYATNEPMNAELTVSEVANETYGTTADDGWSSGSFYIEKYTGYKYFNGGTIYVAIRSSAPSNNDYYVDLYKGNTFIARLTPSANGTTTLNYVNVTSGNYRLYFSKDDITYKQSYEILSYGSF